MQNVGLSVGDEHHVELVERLVDESNIVLLDDCVLSAAVCQLGERRKESLDTRSGHLSKLSREDSFPASGADGGCENNLASR